MASGGQALELQVTTLLQNHATKQVNIPLADASHGVPGTIKVDEEGRLLQSYLTYAGFTSDQIAAYEYAINYSIPQIINQKVIDLSPGKKPNEPPTYVIFRNVEYMNPRVSPTKADSPLLFPQQVRDKQNRSYSLHMKIDIEERVYGTDEVMIRNGIRSEVKGIHIADIPVMRGSSFDNLVQARSTELLQKGECPHDPLGYFIVKGTERVVMMQERLRAMRVLAIAGPKSKPICLMTCQTVRGTTVVRLERGTDTKEAGGRSIQLSLYEFKDKKTMNVFDILRVLDPRFDDTDIMMKRVLAFVKDEWKRKVQMALQGTLIGTVKVANVNAQLLEVIQTEKEKAAKLEEIQKSSRGKARKMRKLKTNLYVGTTPEGEARIKLLAALFPQIVLEEYTGGVKLSELTSEQKRVAQISWIQSKIDLLSVMIARFAEYLAGLRPLDDKDSWINKRIESAGRLMEQLFRRLWNATMDEIEKYMTAPNDYTLQKIINGMQNSKINIITKCMEKSFTPNQWGPPGIERANITETLERGESLIASYAQLLKVNTPTNRQSKQSDLRSLHPSQIKFIGPIDTPSSEACGLVNAKALGCYVSVDPNPNENVLMMNYMSDFLSAVSDIQHPNYCIYNGKPVGWCDGEALRTSLIKRRRAHQIMDRTSVVMENNILNVYTDGARPTAAFLIIDEKGQLVIDEKKLWGAPFEQLVAEGAVEFLDAWEMSASAYVAESVSTMRYIKRDLAKSKDELNNTIAQLAEAEQLLAVHPSNDLPPEIAAQLVQWQAGDHATIEDIVTLKESLKDKIGLGALTEFEKWLQIAQTVQELNMRKDLYERTIQRYIQKGQWTHAEMDPNSILGISASLIPFLTNSPGPRMIFQCSMSKQALGINHSNRHTRFSTTEKTLAHPTRPIVQTQMNNIVGLDNLPAGDTVIMAIMSHPNTEEDGLVIKKEAIERGLFTSTVYHTYSANLSVTQNNNGRKSSLLLYKPTTPFPGHTIDDYLHLDKYGIAIPGRAVKAGEAIIGRIRKIEDTDRGKGFTKTTVEDASIYMRPWEEGIIDRVRYSKNAKNEMVIMVRIRQTRKPIIGDKLATRAAQKSVISKIEKASNMPFISRGPGAGIRPDIILNAHALPSRMTIGTLLEILSSKWGALVGEKVNATAFKEFDLEELMQKLKELGYNEFGLEEMTDGRTGQVYPSMIMVGPSYYQALRHMVIDKIQVRGRGAVNILTRQPPRGKKKGGGIRVGEMETHALLAHGAPYMLRERMCRASDAYNAVFCINCGTIPITNRTARKITCRTCKEQNFGTCTIPYIYKQLLSLLSLMGVSIKQVLQRNEALEEGEIEEEEEEEEEEEVEEEEEEFDVEFDEL